MKRTIAWSLALVAAVGLMAVLLLLVHRTPHFESLKSAYKSTDRAILDRNGLLIDEIHREKSGHRFNWVEFDEVPKFIRKALLADDAQLAQQVSAWQSAGLSSGQLAKYLQARVLELTWKKSELAEAFLNLAVYRSELQGFSAASFGLFDKAPENLTRSEAAVILALENNSAKNNLTERACDWLVRMGTPEECGLLSQDHLAQIEKSYRIRPFTKMAPHFTERLKNNPEIAQGSVVRSTLDRGLQESAIQSLQVRGLFDSAVIVVENSTGNVLVYVNNVTATEDLIEHPAGAMLQPLIYAQAIDERVLTAASMLEDSPLAISSRANRYRPPHRSLVSVREALTAGSNIPALAALELVTPESFTKNLIALGFSGFDHAESFGPSLALGSVNVQLLELTNAYRSLANGGMWSPLRLSPDKMSEKPPKRVLSPEAVFIVRDILTDHNGRAVFAETNGHWSVGFSDKYTVGVWAGREMAAASLWSEILGRLSQHDEIEKVHPPEGLIRKVVVTAKKEIRDEWFIAGTEPVDDSAKTSVRSRISYPENLSLIALDQAKEKNLLIKIVAPRTDQNLYMNGQRLGRAKSYQPWEPHSGKFTLELRDSKGQVVDKVRFEVRGRSFALAH